MGRFGRRPGQDVPAGRWDPFGTPAGVHMQDNRSLLGHSGQDRLVEDDPITGEGGGQMFRFSSVMLYALLSTGTMATTYYVDYADGDNGNSGTSTASPWKHAPGDPQATGAPASVVLTAGDVVRFRAGVAYRGSIRLKHSGNADAQILYTGLGWGSGRAIIDGGDPVTSTIDCPDADTCGGATNWQSLKYVTFSTPQTSFVRLFDSVEPLTSTQYPPPDDPFWADDLDNFIATPVSQAATIESGRLDNAELAALATVGSQLIFWVSGNQIRYRTITAISGDSMYFTANGLLLYHDRNGRVALSGSPKTMSDPGTYALLSGTQAIVNPRDGGGGLSVGNGRYGFDLGGRSFVTISGFSFTNGTASASATTEGVALQNNIGSGYATGVRFENNVVGPASLQNGRGVVTVNRANGIVISDNDIRNIQAGSGIRTLAYNSNVTVLRNKVSRVGRTGIYFGAVSGGLVQSNVVRQIYGIHGNAMSFYLANTNIAVRNNCVYDSDRPLTYHGSSDANAPDNNLLFEGNILVTNSAGTSAMTSYGKYVEGVVIRTSVMIGTRWGLTLDTDDRHVTVQYNRMRPILVTGGGNGPDWTLNNNDITATYQDASAGQLSPSQCMMVGYGGMIVVGPI